MKWSDPINVSGKNFSCLIYFFIVSKGYLSCGDIEDLVGSHLSNPGVVLRSRPCHGCEQVFKTSTTRQLGELVYRVRPAAPCGALRTKTGPHTQSKSLSIALLIACVKLPQSHPSHSKGAAEKFRAPEHEKLNTSPLTRTMNESHGILLPNPTNASILVQIILPSAINNSTS